jgi:hypothetical protein
VPGAFLTAGVAQEAEHLHSKHEALSSNPSTTKKKDCNMSSELGTQHEKRVSLHSLEIYILLEETDNKQIQKCVTVQVVINTMEKNKACVW